MPHLRALVKDAGKGAMCPRVWLEREGILVEQAAGRWVVDDRHAEAYKERLKKEHLERMEDVKSGRWRWYVGLPPPLRPGTYHPVHWHRGAGLMSGCSAWHLVCVIYY